ncbi:MAG: hypothetical protein ACLR6J_03985 [Parabacteroides merdae]
MPSASDSRQPYRLSNFDFSNGVADIDGRNQRFTFFHHLVQAVRTPAVVSSETRFISGDRAVPTGIVFSQDTVLRYPG